MDSRTFTVTSSQLDGLVTYLAGQGLVLDPSVPAGECKEKGWDVSWQIAPGELTINLIQHPFLKAGAFWSRIGNVLKPA